MKTITTCSLIACGAALAAPRISRADERAPGAYSYAWHDSRLQSDIGIATILGGGVTGFTSQTMRDVTNADVAPLWDLRVSLGSHIPIGLDVSYLGSTSNIDALTSSQTGTLVGTTVEGALRYNVLPHNAWNPYAFAGVGWQRYDITGVTMSLSDSGMNPHDNSVVFPMGAGIGYRDAGLVLDVRGTFRANTGYGLVLENATATTYAPMHTWEASVAAGYEF